MLVGRDLLESLFRETIRRLDPTAVTANAVAAARFEGLVTVVAAGKAAVAMTRGALSVLGDRVASGCVVAASAAAVELPLEVLVGSHPLPTQASVRAGEALLAAVGSGHPVLALISGGASALACVPAPGVGLAEKLAVTSAVMRGGAPIGELNTVRKHLSAIKGGQLAAAASAAVTTFAVSDVAGDQLTEIASGPTVPDPTTIADARDVIERYAPAHLAIADKLVNTVKIARPGDAASVIAGTRALIDRAAEVARERGLTPKVIGRDLAAGINAVAAQIAGSIGNGLFIAGGEPTIALPAHPGAGGRAHHLALLLAKHIRGRQDSHILVAGSDGIDGNTNAAGAIVDGTTWDAVDDPDGALAKADSHTALAKIGASLVTGPTGVNHADLIIVLTQ